MKLPLVRKHTADDVLVHSATALGTLKDLSSVISPIPCIGAVIGSGLSLIAALEKVKGDKERCDRLAGRVASMLDDVARLTSTNSDGMNDAVSATLMTMPSSLSDIQRDLEDISKKSASVRYIQRGSIAARLDRHLWNVDEASRAFNRALLLDIASNANLQAGFDKHGLRLFRYPELNLCRVRGTWSTESGVCASEWEGEWQGRAIIIRVLRPEHSTEDVLSSMIDGISLCRHPNIVQFLGRSHPHEQQKFIVLEQAPVDVLEYFMSMEPLTRVRCYLQMHIDYESTLEHLLSIRFPVAQIDEIHCHDNCLPSLAIKGHGTMVLSAEDLMHGVIDCLCHRLCNLIDPNHRPASTVKTLDFTFSEGPRILLAVLEPGTDKPSCVTDLSVLHDLACIAQPAVWCYSWFAGHTDVRLGEYGYIDPETQLFVSLGNVAELLQCEESLYWQTKEYINDKPIEHTWGYIWSERSWRYPLLVNSSNVRVVSHQVSESAQAEFFWSKACIVAELHGIEPQELMLIDIVNYRWNLSFDEVDDHWELSGNTRPSEMYFHQQPPLENGAVPVPFGYWSLEPQFVLETHQDIVLPGIRLGGSVDVGYAFLNEFQAELVACFTQQLNARAVQDAVEDVL